MAAYEHEDQLEVETIEWFKKNCSEGDRLSKVYDKQRISEFASRVHRNGISYKRMFIISKTYLTFTFWDDLLDRNPHLWDKVATSVMDVTMNKEIDHSDSKNYLLTAWCDLWQEIISITPKQWQENFANSLQNWFASSKIENAIRSSKRLLSYNEYHSIRLISVFVEVCFDFIEFAQNEYLTMEERANSTFKLFFIHAKTIVYLTNDLYSWPKEKRVGDNMNIMYIHQELAKMSEEEAIATIVEQIKKELEAMYYGQLSYAHVSRTRILFDGIVAIREGKL